MVPVCAEKTLLQHENLWKFKICVSVPLRNLLLRSIRVSFYRPHSCGCQSCSFCFLFQSTAAHKNPNQIEWSSLQFTWTAPAQSAGNITFM